MSDIMVDAAMAAFLQEEIATIKPVCVSFNALLHTRPASSFRDEAGMRGRLRRQLCDLYRHLPKLLPYIRIIVHQLASLSYEHYLHNGMIQEPWSLRWKAISEQGGDMIGTQFVDYGNREYTDVFAFFYAYDDQMAALIDWLVAWWPSLSPFDRLHRGEHGISMKGDVVEICLAALRGHQFMGDLLHEQLKDDGLTMPIVFNWLCNLCRLIHMLRGTLDTGKFKWCKEVVPKLSDLHAFERNGFVQLWTDLEQSDLYRPLLLAAFFR